MSIHLYAVDLEQVLPWISQHEDTKIQRTVQQIHIHKLLQSQYERIFYVQVQDFHSHATTALKDFHQELTVPSPLIKDIVG